jgi:hypothetical protein
MRACRQSLCAAILAFGFLASGESRAVPMPAEAAYGIVIIFDIEITGGVVASIDVPPTTLNTYRLEGAPPDVVVQFDPRPNVVDCPVGGTSCRIQVGAGIDISVVTGAAEVEIDFAGFEMMISSAAGGTVSLGQSNGGGQSLRNGSDPEGFAAITSSGAGEFGLGDQDDFYLETPSVLLDLSAGMSLFHWEGAFIEFTVERVAAATDVPAPASAALLLAAIGGLARGRRSRVSATR